MYTTNTCNLVQKNSNHSTTSARVIRQELPLNAREQVRHRSPGSPSRNPKRLPHAVLQQIVQEAKSEPYERTCSGERNRDGGTVATAE
ncbi:hypothetical protein MRB53_038376 [Persea americana]|nr:hypothetical protein MRB53_038376 [Persea americana]